MDAIKAAALAALVSWTAHSFTMDGQVMALNQAVMRIEARVDQLAKAQGLPEPKEVKK